MRSGTLLLAALLALSACSTNLSPNSNATPGATPAASFNQFSDIPIPEDAHMDVDRSLLVGQGENWLGRLVFKLRWDHAPAIFDFYKAQMAGYKWQELSSVRAEISVLIYQRGNRVATVQIEDNTIGVGCEVIITMGPANGSNAADVAQPNQPNQPNQPVAPAPAPEAPVTEQPLK